VLAKMMLNRRDRVPALALGLLFTGVLIVKIGSIFQPGTAFNNMWRGDLLFATAALMWSFYIVLMRRWNTQPLAVVSIVQVCGLAYVPLYFLTQGTEVMHLNFSALSLQVLYQGILVSVISVLLFNLAVQKIGAKASMFTALMPIVGVTLAIILLGETLTITLIFGTVLIVGGLLLSLKKNN
jgi:drug/metabolite transporter (DMT)-like permease